MTTFNPPTFTANEFVPASAAQAVQDSMDAICPVGSYLLIHAASLASATTINGAWLLCDGASVSTSTYPSLFAVIGYTYGGSGASFNVPDLRGRTMFQAAATGNSDAILGRNDGAAIGSRRPKHSHTVGSTHGHTTTGAGSSGPSSTHFHSIPNAAVSTVVALHGGTSRPFTNSGSVSTTGENTDHVHSISGSTTSNAAALSTVGNGLSANDGGQGFLVVCQTLIRAI